MPDHSVPEAQRAPERAGDPGHADLASTFHSVRALSIWLCEPLEIEDHVLQCVTEASPTRWHLAHTTWFFERFILQEFVPGYAPLDENYYFLFNSYYQALGPRHSRPNRGQLSRPTVEEVLAYRRAIDLRLGRLLEDADETILAAVAPLVTLGCQHEQQHQELMLTDLLVNLWHNPLLPAYRSLPPAVQTAAAESRWIPHDGGIHKVGSDGPGFHYDNEGPRHEVLLRPYALASRLTTNAEFLAFVEDGGYERPAFWLDLGFSKVRQAGWTHPLYWLPRDGTFLEYTLGGARPLNPDEPVSHLSFFEADAFARWSGQRLPLEAEWEVAAAGLPIQGNLLEARRFRPLPAKEGTGLQQMFGDLWEWTASPYTGYPGYRPPTGAVGEYNGKFMCNQYVLRGGSLATQAAHLRATYRNFFPPETRWQFSGLRLAKDL